MGVTVCELCGGTEFRKEGGEFVCQECGCRYSLEDARRLVHDDRHPGPHGRDAGFGRRDDVAEFIGDFAASVVTGMTAVSRSVLASLVGPREINNEACRMMGETSQLYRREKHPGEQHMRAAADDAAACLAALDRAASVDLDAHAQNILIFENCRAIKGWLDGCWYYKPGKDGEDVRTSFRSAGKSAFPMPIDRSAASSLAALRDWHDVDWGARSQADREFLRNEYLNAHPENMQRRDELEGQVALAEAELGELKSEKKGKGFFNFSEKREVKERMEPVKEHLGSLRAQIREIDQMADNYVEALVDEVAASGFARIDLR